MIFFSKDYLHKLLMFFILTWSIFSLPQQHLSSETVMCYHRCIDTTFYNTTLNIFFIVLLWLVNFPKPWFLIGQMMPCHIRAHRRCCTQHYYVSLIDQTPLSHSRHWFSHMTPHTSITVIVWLSVIIISHKEIIEKNIILAYIFHSRYQR